jgi:nucleotide sugar dehydrogenase
MRIGVIGLGKLGLPFASLVSQHYETYGFDIDRERITKLKEATLTTYEPNCNYRSVCFTTFIGDVCNCDAAFLCVNTPTLPDQTMDLSQVKTACQIVASHLREDSRLKSLVVLSTVLPGTNQTLIKPILPHLDIYSCPVWIAMGSVIRDLKNPPITLIGHPNKSVPDWLKDFWSQLSPESTQLACDPTTAEFIKLMHNAWCTTKMAFMGFIGDNVKNVDIKAIESFFQNGGERSGKYWQYGPPFGGPCFPRDLHFWNLITNHPITKLVEAQNNFRLYRIAISIPQNSNVLILGAGYKFGLPITEESLSAKLSDLLRQKGCTVTISDNYHAIKADYVIVAHDQLSHLSKSYPKARIINLWQA